MKKKTFRRVITLVLALAMLLSVVPVTAYAAWADDNVVYDGTSFGTDGYYNVISKKDYTLVPGAATETEIVLNNSTGNHRQVMHILECDPSNPDISIVPGYYNIDKDITDVNNWQAAGMSDMVAKYENELGYNVVCGMNTALAYDNNAPYSYLVYNGEVLVDRNNNINNFHSGDCKSLLCVYKDAETGKCTCELRTYSQGLRGDEWQAIGANFAMTVNNGQLVSTKVDRSTGAAAARSMIGVKEDGTLVLVMNDGRGANNSIGFNNYELGESMLALGCKWAFNCDGGGSSGFLTKRAGETEVTMRAVPCDGAERPTLNGVMVVSNVGPTGELNNVNINSDYDYFAPGTSYTFGAEAIDTHGYAMDMPADASWSLSDASFGTVENGAFTSNGTLGDVDVQVESGGKVVGTKTIHIANPTTLDLSATTTTLPYSTPEKVRTITLPMVAKIGENEVYTSGAYDISVSPENGGTIDGLKFTATDDTSVSSATISINYLPTNTPFTYTVNYGKGSEILWDFEDGNRNGFVGTDEADQYMRENGAAVTTSGTFSTPFRTLFSGGQISWSNKTTTAISSVAEGGKAHGGDKSLAVTFDMKNVEFNSWVYSIVYNINGNLVLRDVENGNNATALGAWVYVPKGFRSEKNAGSQALQLTVQKGKSATATLSGTQLNMQYKGKNINALTEADIPENRWIYVKADLTANNYVKLVDPLNDVYRSPSFARMYVKPSEAQEMTYYFDDFTIDYSSAVDDREPPVISNPTYCTNDTNIAFADQTLNTNVVSFDANVADFAASNAEGLDYSSAKIYVDGVAQSGVKASGNTMGIQNVNLSNGVHKITFEIADKLGNASTLSKNITIAADGAKSAVRLSGHNDKDNTIEAGSVYYVDVVADAAEDIDSVTTTIELQSAHEWELDHMIVADGFEASYELNSIKDNVATITITNKGSKLTGEQTLVSLPARVWSFDENTLVGGDSSAAPKQMTAAARYATNYGEPVLLMEANVLYGEITYTNDAKGTFGGSISEATAVTGNKTAAWHEHDAELTVQNKAATCTEDGYENRTYCETCGSVVDWGETVPATGHTYELVDGKFVCSVCEDELELGTGIIEMNGEVYYAIAGKLVSGWQTVDGDTYYFNPDNYAAVNGKFTVKGIEYEFENHILAHGTWVDDGKGLLYYWAGEHYHSRWFDDENGNRYHFDATGYAARGYVNVAQGHLATLYHFDETTGALIETITENGIFFTHNETEDIFYIMNGYLSVAGLVQYGNDYYYFPGTFKALKNTSRYIDEAGAHGYVEPGTYYFNADGKLIDPNLKNGPQDDGYFYVNGVRQKCYQVVQWEGDYYFISDGHLLAKNARIYLGEQFVAGTDLKPSYYNFDADGKIVLNSGPNADGYFYLNGIRQNCYQLIEWNDNFYFINDGHKYAKNAKLYLTNSFRGTEDLMPGYYDFDSEGKMIKKNGPDANGYFYLDGVLQKGTQLISYADDYYYINSDNKFAKSTSVYLSGAVLEGTGLADGYYTFNSAGKLDTRTGPQSDGYFYINGVMQKAYKIVEWEGDYYFIYDGHKIAKNVKLYLGDQFVAGTDLTPGYYNFDADGKIMLNSGPADDGYFYLRGVRQNCYQLIKFEGDYYFVSDSHKYAKSAHVYLVEKFLEGTGLMPGYYDFDASGKMIKKNGPDANGYFYLDGVVQDGPQLINYNDNYYYVKEDKLYAKSVTLHLTDDVLEDTDLEEGDYTFDSTGKLDDRNGPQSDGYFYLNGVRQKCYQLILFNGHYYFISDGHKYAVSKRLYMSESFTNGKTYPNGVPVSPGYYNFDDEGKMVVGVVIDGVKNVRDIGGWTTTDGKHIKNGMLIRGGELDGVVNPESRITETGINTMLNDLKIKSQLDLRSSEVFGEDMLGADVPHTYFNAPTYGDIFNDSGKAIMKDIFTELAKPENYPTYVNCTHGVDRTGTVCFILEAVLGLSEADLQSEYGLSIGYATYNRKVINEMKTTLANNYAGSNIKERATAYLLDCGITQEQIDSIRSILLVG